MPRKPRMYLPGVPCHIIQRGNNRDATLFETALNTADSQVIRNAVRFSIPTGDNQFKKQIERMLNRKVGYAYRGRHVKPE